MMQKYSTPAIVPGSGNGQNTAEAIFGSVDVYLAADVDKYRETSCDIIAANGRELTRMAARIAELDQQLAGANATIALFMGPDGDEHIEHFASVLKSLMVK